MTSSGRLTASAIALCIALAATQATAHQPVTSTSGTETTSVPSVHNCATFEWTTTRRCSTYDTTTHRWQVTNACPRAVKVRWADNSYQRPIRRDEESGKPKAESAVDLRAGKTKKGAVDCVDKAELEMCIEYVYPPLKEHDKSVRCSEFFD